MKDPSRGAFLALEIGTVEIAVGVPTAPISAKMLSSSISFRGLDDRATGIVAVIAADKVQLAAVHAAPALILQTRQGCLAACLAPSADDGPSRAVA